MDYSDEITKELHFASESVTVSQVLQACAEHCPVKVENVEEYGIYIPSKGKWIEPLAPTTLLISSFGDNEIEYKKRPKMEITVEKEEEGEEEEDKEEEERRKESLAKFKRDLLGIKTESDMLEVTEEKKGHKRGHSQSKGKEKDKENAEIHTFVKSVQKFLKKRPPTSELAQLSLERGKQLTFDDLEPVYLDYDIIEYCTSYLERLKDALTIEGVYRISGDSVFVKHMWACFVLENPSFLESDAINPHVVTGALRLYLRELKDPLIPFDYYDKFVAATRGNMEIEARVNLLKQYVSELDSITQHSLSTLFKHLKHVVSMEEVNKMGYENVSIVFGPTVLRPKQETMDTMMDNSSKCQAVALLVEYCEKIFVDLKELPEKGERSLAPVDPKERKKREKKKKEEEEKKKKKEEEKKKPEKKQSKEEEKEEDEEERKRKEKPSAKVSRAYGDVIAMFDSTEIVGASMVFVSKMEEDAKSFLKHISKSHSPEQLANVIYKLAQVVSQGARKPSSHDIVESNQNNTPLSTSEKVLELPPENSSPVKNEPEFDTSSPEEHDVKENSHSEEVAEDEN